MDVSKGVFWPLAVAFVLTLVCPTGCWAAPGDPLNMPSMNVFDHKSVIIHDNKGGTAIGSYDQKSGNWWLSEPGGKYTTGARDGWGNETIIEYGGGEDDD